MSQQVPIKLSGVAEAGWRQQVAAVLAEFLAKVPGTADTSWLQEMRARGVPLYGTMDAQPGKIIRLEPDGPQVQSAHPGPS